MIDVVELEETSEIVVGVESVRRPGETLLITPEVESSISIMTDISLAIPLLRVEDDSKTVLGVGLNVSSAGFSIQTLAEPVLMSCGFKINKNIFKLFK
jgi:hypothetical protein